MQAVGTDICAAERAEVFRCTAKDTMVRMFFNQDTIFVHLDIDSVLFNYLKYTTHFGGLYDTSEVVNFSDNSSRFLVHSESLLKRGEIERRWPVCYQRYGQHFWYLPGLGAYARDERGKYHRRLHREPGKR